MLPQLRALAESAHPAPARRVAVQAFSDLTRLLGYLDAVDSAGTNGEDVGPLLSIIQGEALSLGDFLDAARAGEQPDRPLAEALESAAFAIRHELRRVFDRELRPAATAAGGDVARHADADTTEVLRNCFQQAVVIVAHALDPGVSDVSLFGDIELRRERSQLLYEDLSALLRLVRHTEQHYSPQALSLFVVRLHDFRQRGMRYLMSKDWVVIENFAARVSSQRSERAVKTFLHQFGSYLEILLGHVRMRAVLAG